MRLRLLSAVAGALALLGGCSLAPEYQVPEAAAPAAYGETSGAWQTAAPADTAARGAWWSRFGDPTLDALEADLITANQDWRAAVARYEQARALARRARAPLRPRIDAGASATRAEDSATTASGGGAPYDHYSTSLDLSWEIDLFGRLRNAADAAGARLQASAGDLASLQLGLQAELAMQYFALRGAEATQALLQSSETAYARALDIVRRRYIGGIAAATDVDQAETQLENTRAQLAAVRQQHAQLGHALAVLLGRAPSDLRLAPAPELGDAPALDPGLPSTLLQRRPDIAAAERRVAVANADIGVARAAWFPVFSFGAAGGYASATGSDWLEAPSRFWSLGPAVSLPLLDGGLRSAVNQQARAAHDQAAAEYRQTVLLAYREVEDQLAALHHLADEMRSDEAAARAAQRSADHAQRRYEAGVADYLEVTFTQTAALQARRAALDARLRRLAAGVSLVRALGGGWSADQLDRPQLAAANTSALP